jgi:hypothetical protein
LRWTGEKTWTVKAEETFARGFERYLYDGIAPNQNLVAAFARTKIWMRDIYGSIQQDSSLNLDLDRVAGDGKTIRQTFDGWFNYGNEADPAKVVADLK